MKTAFIAARPVWIAGRETEKNVTALFVAKIGRGEARIDLTASCIYRMFVNGRFVEYGPARGPQGYFRIDRVDLTPYCTEEENYVAVEVAGYNINTYYLMDQPSFLQAEIVKDGAVVAKTAVDGDFLCRRITRRTQKVQRYSFQRPFAERWMVDKAYYDAYVSLPDTPEVLAEGALVKYLERGVAFPALEESPCVQIVSSGTAEFREEKLYNYADRSLVGINKKLKGFDQGELEFWLTEDATHLHFLREENKPRLPLGTEVLSAGEWITAKFRCNLSGFIKLKLKTVGKTRLTLLFDELVQDNDINPWRMRDCCNVVDVVFEEGEYTFCSFEPYTLQGLKIVCREGAAELSRIAMVEYSCSIDAKQYTGYNENLRKIWDAAIETYRQNAVDLFTDCPSRERAGWLCDSYWTARVEKCLTGNSVVERNFLENYLLPDSFTHLPDGMVPMCYPADHNDGNFIPNWSMWLVLELREYLERSGDRAMIDAFRDKIYKLLHYLDTFLNEDGLLEHLPAWVFVEWSQANKLVQDVNYPSNMLYAACLEACGEMYGDKSLFARAAAMRKTILEQSFDGEFFVDNALRREGALVLSGERTEVCQYYAFYFNIATPESHPVLWERLLRDFGPHREANNKFPEIHFANAFIGNYLRLDLLARYGYRSLVVENIEGYFTKMAEMTGTLWEHDRTHASLNHGFASHVVCWLSE
ncbi:MAG: hypothetical protein J6C26_08935 [Clostridia bacterium]|nr:hypothetical protein [Clostridia bacterium]